MVSSWEDGAICHKAVNACLCPLYAVEGMHVVTVEGGLSARLGQERNIQKNFDKRGNL
jgi:xanthine dehydrogenase iron-sulfur cluster and FAD-binding subunit A